MIYRKQGYVTGSMCDASVRMSAIAAFNLIEDSVTELMGSMHIDGVTAMKKYGAMWVFSKNLMKFYRKPDWLDEFNIRCFISSHSALRLFVDTEITSGTGEMLVGSRVEICAIDLEAAKLRKPQTVGFTEDMEHADQAGDYSFDRFSKEPLNFTESVKVRSMNIDYCSHTNNIEYVRFILNNYPVDFLSSESITGIELHYLGQTYEGDVLDIESEIGGLSDRFNIRCNGKQVIACRIDRQD